MNPRETICVVGHTGMVGHALVETLTRHHSGSILTASTRQVDLRDQTSTRDYFKENKPDVIYLIAGTVGGIQANIDHPARFLYDNLMIAANVIEAARQCEVRKLLYLGSSCIYPRHCEQPMKEEHLLTGSLEPTNEGYAIGKIVGVKLCQYYRAEYGCDFIAAIPPNLYGPRDNFSSKGSHVASALIDRIHRAKMDNKPSVEIWGTGTARREFLYTPDLADGLVFLMDNYSSGVPINIGAQRDVSIRDLADTICRIVGYSGELFWNSDKPDGMPRKLMDSSAMTTLGWTAPTSLEDGLAKVYEWYKTKPL